MPLLVDIYIEKNLDEIQELHQLDNVCLQLNVRMTHDKG
jgi:hypothetical protein